MLSRQNMKDVWVGERGASPIVTYLVMASFIDFMVIFIIMFHSLVVWYTEQFCYLILSSSLILQIFFLLISGYFSGFSSTLALLLVWRYSCVWLLLMWLALKVSYLALACGPYMSLIQKRTPHLWPTSLFVDQFWDSAKDWSVLKLSLSLFLILPAPSLIQLPSKGGRNITTWRLFREHKDMDRFKGIHVYIFSFQIYLKLIWWCVCDQPLLFSNHPSLN